MRRFVTALFSVILALALLAPASSAQLIAENHYKTYEVDPPETITIPLRVADQFGEIMFDTMVLDKFANPVSKNFEGIFDPRFHQLWWELPPGLAPDERLVGFDNQFGRQDWIVRDSRYLVNPFDKFALTTLLPPWNHYLCYDAEGPTLPITVQLLDQFGQMTSIVGRPVYFCNPAVKTHQDGTQFPIVNPEAHLACYELEPDMPFLAGVFGIDQFGNWDFVVTHPNLLCVPTFKLTVVSTEETSWGKVKALYDE